MKIYRLLGIITLLLQQEKVTAFELASRFEVSRRTIQRDIEDICKAGIPLVTQKGAGGGVFIAEGYVIEKSLFNQEELQVILAGLKGFESVSQHSYVAQCIEKLSSKKKPLAFDESIIINLASHYQDSLTEKIEVIRQAIYEQKVISFTYYSGKGESLRKIEAYHLVFKWSSWYVFGYCLGKQDFRLFKLNRLWDLQNTEEKFILRVVPKGKLNFDRYFLSEKIFLKAIFEESEKYRLIDEYGRESFTIMEDKRLLFQRSFVNYENMKEFIFSFGDKVQILEPKKLIEERKIQAKHILEQITP